MLIAIQAKALAVLLASAWRSMKSLEGRTAVTRLVAAGAASLVLGAAFAGALGPAASADPKQLAYGQHLAQECTTCHRRDAADGKIPPIVGLEPDYFVTTMRFYQTGARDNPVMVSVAQALNDEQLKALAAYFATLKPAPAATKGRKK